MQDNFKGNRAIGILYYMKKKHIVTEAEKNKRVDKLLSSLDDSLSRNSWQRQITQGNVKVNSSQVKPSYKVTPGEKIKIDTVEDLQIHKLKPQNLPLDVVYEDNQIIGINKKSSTVVHPGPGNWDGTLANALIYHYENLPRPTNHLRPGIVHRLDKETSGIVVVARTEKAFYTISNQFRNREINKEYLALVEGHFTEKEGLIKAPIGRNNKIPTRMAVKLNGKDSETEFSVLKEFQNSTLLKICPKTGRTHQIRVHMDYIEHPVLGDSSYGGPSCQRMMLHALNITLTHPKRGQKLTLTAPTPHTFNQVLANISAI